MASKTFKIGEYCKGGIITAVATKTKITIIGKEWDFSKGSNKGSDQSNAKEWIRREFTTKFGNPYRDMYNFLSDLTTHYYAEQVLEWCESKSDMNKQLFW